MEEVGMGAIFFPVRVTAIFFSTVSPASIFFSNGVAVQFFFN